MSNADPIVIVEYDPEWPELFWAEAGRLREALGPLARRIDHVGSTSVPELAAKPIIDIQVSVTSLVDSPGGGSPSSKKVRRFKTTAPAPISGGAPFRGAAPSSAPRNDAGEPSYGPWKAILESLGYRYFHDPDFEDYPFLCRPPDWPHAYHIHVCESGSYHEWRHLAFRDALRADTGLRGRYADLKRRLAKAHSAATHESRNAYADAKGDFIQAAIELAPPADSPG